MNFFRLTKRKVMFTLIFSALSPMLGYILFVISANNPSLEPILALLAYATPNPIHYYIFTNISYTKESLVMGIPIPTWECILPGCGYIATIATILLLLSLYYLLVCTVAFIYKKIR